FGGDGLSLAELFAAITTEHHPTAAMPLAREVPELAHRNERGSAIAGGRLLGCQGGDQHKHEQRQSDTDAHYDPPEKWRILARTPRASGDGGDDALQVMRLRNAGDARVIERGAAYFDDAERAVRVLRRCC